MDPLDDIRARLKRIEGKIKEPDNGSIFWIFVLVLLIWLRGC